MPDICSDAYLWVKIVGTRICAAQTNLLLHRGNTMTVALSYITASSRSASATTNKPILSSKLCATHWSARRRCEVCSYVTQSQMAITDLVSALPSAPRSIRRTSGLGVLFRSSESSKAMALRLRTPRVIIASPRKL